MSTDAMSDQPAIITGDFNDPRFFGRPNRAVTIGERVIAHDDDPTVGDYWATVVSIRPPETLHGPNAAECCPHGLVTLEVTWELA
jgi:hypothetical protein